MATPLPTRALRRAVPILQAHLLANLPLVRDLDANPACTRESFHWPLDRYNIQHAPTNLIYGTPARPGDSPEFMHVFRWTGAGVPLHVNRVTYSSSFATPEQQQESAGLLVPGISIVHFLGPHLAFCSPAGCGSNAAHPGVAAMVLDDVMARVTIANMPDRPVLTANLQLDYLRPVRMARAVVANGWVTRIDSRKIFVSAHVADAHDGSLLVQARSLFVCLS